jgi:hypothetical protein
LKKVSIFENKEEEVIRKLKIILKIIMSTKASELSILGNKDFDTILLGFSLVFTIGVLISLAIISRQVMKSKWIDSNSMGVLIALILIILVMISIVWVSYLLYVGVL